MIHFTTQTTDVARGGQVEGNQKKCQLRRGVFTLEGASVHREHSAFSFVRSLVKCAPKVGPNEDQFAEVGKLGRFPYF